MSNTGDSSVEFGKGMEILHCAFDIFGSIVSTEVGVACRVRYLIKSTHGGDAMCMCIVSSSRAFVITSFR